MPRRFVPPGHSRMAGDTASLRQLLTGHLLDLTGAVLFGGGLIWGLVGRVDQTVSARGRLVPAGNCEVDVPQWCCGGARERRADCHCRSALASY